MKLGADDGRILDREFWSYSSGLGTNKCSGQLMMIDEKSNLLMSLTSRKNHFINIDWYNSSCLGGLDLFRPLTLSRRVVDESERHRDRASSA